MSKTSRAYPQEVEDFLRAHSKEMRYRDMVAVVNEKFGTAFTASSLKAYYANHGITSGFKGLTSKEREAKIYTPEMVEFIYAHSDGVSNGNLAKMLRETFDKHITEQMVRHYRQKHGLKSGLTGRWEKGHETFNKDMKQTEYMSPEAIERTKATQFKPGNVPKKYRPLGSIYIDKDGYKLIKVREDGKRRCDNWKPLNRVIWEQNFGPIPEGMVVAYKDGNRENDSPDNLMLITRGENMTLNKLDLRSTVPEITETGLTIVRIKQAVRKRGRKEKDGREREKRT